MDDFRYELGSNLISNGDFRDGFRDWNPEVFGDARGTWTIDENKAKIDLLDPGSQTYYIMLWHPIALRKGVRYAIELDCRSTVKDRRFHVIVEHHGGDYTKYFFDTMTSGPNAGTSKRVWAQFEMTVDDDDCKLGLHVASHDWGTAPLWFFNVAVRPMIALNEER